MPKPSKPAQPTPWRLLWPAPPNDLPSAFPAPWPFDLAATLNSGQVFHWSQADHAGEPCWAGCVGDTPVWLRQQAGANGLPADVWFSGEPPPDLLRAYLGLDHDMAAILGTFKKRDAALHAAIQFCPGLRILRQPAWECLATFITSALKQVPHIRQISLKLRQHFGQEQAPGLSAYPSPQALADAGEAALRKMGLGFRAKSLHGTAVKLAAGEVDLEKIAQLPTSELEAALRTLPGVGPKIAHCVMLFGFDRPAAFPIDVWVERVLQRLYFDPKSKSRPPKQPKQPTPDTVLTHKALAAFAERQFGPWRGYAQQFLFHQARLTMK